MTKFSPPTYQDAHPAHDPQEKVQCSKCPRKVWPWALQDVRGLPALSFDWLCDGCLSDMKRHCIPIDGGSKPATRAAWRTRLLEAHGAPAAAIAASRGFENGRRPY